jgi:hypothetical protein
MKLPIYFEAFGSIGVTVSFVAKRKEYKGEKNWHGTVSMLLSECPDEMRNAVNAHWELHSKHKISGYELKAGQYVYSEPLLLK